MYCICLTVRIIDECMVMEELEWEINSSVDATAMEFAAKLSEYKKKFNY